MDFGITLLAMLFLQPHDAAFGSTETCHVASTGRPEGYTLVRIQEIETGKVVFQSTLRGGQTKDVFSGSKKIKVEHKLPGDKDYHSPVVADCKGGNTISISPRETQERAFGAK